MYFCFQTTRDNTDLAVDCLTDTVSNQAFKPWELNDSLPRMKLELAGISPATQALELLHLAAFRYGSESLQLAVRLKVHSLSLT